MSDSSDIDFSDDDAIFEQRKQQLIAEQQQQQLQFADPAFAAQFDPKSSTYHGNHDPRVVNANEGNKALPLELQKKYGVQSMKIEDMPDVQDNAFNEDPSQFGPIYVQLYSLRDQSLGLKRVLAKLQGLVQEYLRLVESEAPEQRKQNASTTLTDSISTIRLLLPKWSGTLAAVAAFDKDQLAEVGVKTPLGDFDVKKHVRETELIMTNISTMLQLTDSADQLAKEQDLYFNMKRIGTELMSRQQEIMATMKIVKKNYKKD